MWFGDGVKLAAWRLRRAGLGAVYIKQAQQRRFGECKRCGACCHLRSLWPMPMVRPLRCPALAYTTGGLSACALHGYRPGLCRVFPIDEADLAARDIISPNTHCGYGFHLARGAR